MNREPDKLTAEERKLLGKQSADELLAGESWLAARLDAGRLDESLRLNVNAAVADELARRRHRPMRWTVGLTAAAAVIMTAAFLFFNGPDDSRLADPPAHNAPADVVRVDREIDAYLAAIQQDQADRPDDSLSRLDPPNDLDQEEAVISMLTEPTG